jgi:hypothetical protein
MMDVIATLVNNNNKCDILRKTPSPDFRVPPINLEDLPKFLLGKIDCDFSVLTLQAGRLKKKKLFHFAKCLGFQFLNFNSSNF